MTNYYVPYSGNRPASLSINGHRVIILSTDAESLGDSLTLVGGDRVKMVRVSESKEDQEQMLTRIAKSINGGVVIAPSDVAMEDLIRNLQSELPWVQ